MLLLDYNNQLIIQVSNFINFQKTIIRTWRTCRRIVGAMIAIVAECGVRSCLQRQVHVIMPTDVHILLLLLPFVLLALRRAHARTCHTCIINTYMLLLLCCCRFNLNSIPQFNCSRKTNRAQNRGHGNVRWENPRIVHSAEEIIRE